MRSTHRGWVMPEEDISSMLQMIEEKMTSSEIEVQHRDTLIRLRDILEEDLQRGGLEAATGSCREGNQEAAQTR